MVLRGANRQHVFTIHEEEVGRFFAIHKLFDHDFSTSLTEFATEHIVDGIQRVLFVHRNDHALARSQTIGLHDNRRALFADVILRWGRRGKARISRRRCIRRITNRFGKGFGRFQLRCGLGRAKHL